MKPKNLPRLWCALQGLLPFDACLAAQRGELGWPPEVESAPPSRNLQRAAGEARNGIAGTQASVNVRARASV
jgi:hypothetical protein